MAYVAAAETRRTSTSNPMNAASMNTYRLVSGSICMASATPFGAATGVEAKAGIFEEFAHPARSPLLRTVGQ